jgi:hypothetical protein
MRLYIRISNDSYRKQPFTEIVSGISSLLFYRQGVHPTGLCSEYHIDNGVVWTSASETDHEFQKLLNDSGLLRLVIPGGVSGQPCLFCSPFLGQGIPFWRCNTFGVYAVADTEQKRTEIVVADAGGAMDELPLYVINHCEGGFVYAGRSDKYFDAEVRRFFSL